MNIIEIPVIGSRYSEKEKFYTLLTGETLRNFEGFDLGLLKLDDDNYVYFYFMTMENDTFRYLWDIIIPHAIGCILVCEWRDHQSIDDNLKIIEYLETRFSTPLHICSLPASQDVPESYLNEELQQNNQRKLYSFDPENKESVKNILIQIVDSQLPPS
jgi:signal recognition particle receptor subunit beta